MENTPAEEKNFRNSSYTNQHTKAELTSGTDPSTRQREGHLHPPSYRMRCKREQAIGTPTSIFCTSYELGEETTILPGGCEARHKTHLLACCPQRFSSTSAVSLFTSHRFILQNKTLMECSRNKAWHLKNEQVNIATTKKKCLCGQTPIALIMLGAGS